MKTSAILIVCAWAAAAPGSQNEKHSRAVPGVTATAVLPQESAAPGGGSGPAAQPAGEPLPPAVMALAAGAGDSTDGFGWGGTSYLETALDMCIRGCTPNAYLTGLGITISIVYGPVRILFGGFVSGCIAGCYSAYAYR